MFKGNDLLTCDLVGHVTNYFNMETKIEVYFYNLKSLGEVIFVV